MSKFTEIPYWYIKDFIDKKIASDTYIAEESNIITPDFVLNPILFNNSFPNITTDIYIKTEVPSYYYSILSGSVDEEYVYDYLKLNVTFDNYDEEYINITVNDPYIITSTSTSGGYTVPEGEISIKWFDNIVENNEPVFFRKDSNLYTWLKDYYKENNEYLSNFNKMFLYLGNIYKDNNFDDSHYKIKIDNLYYWSKRAFPDYFTTDKKKLNGFLDICLDRVYSSIYNSQKFIWSVIDSMETPVEFLYFIAKTFNIEVSTLFIESQENKTRVFVNNLIELLKRKGTYSSIFIIGKVNTNHKINVYERWHDVFWNNETSNYLIDNGFPYMSKTESDQQYPEGHPELSGSSSGMWNPKPYFSDYNYLDYYNLDISDWWEYLIKLDELEDYNINLNNIIIQCYDEYIKNVVPVKMEFIENVGLKLYFEDRFTGRICISKSDYSEDLDITGSSKTINHNLSLSASNDPNIVMSQLNTYDINYSVKENINVFYPMYIEYTDDDSIEIKIGDSSRLWTLHIDYVPFPGEPSYEFVSNKYDINIIVPEYTYNQTTESNSWTINHDRDDIVSLVQTFIWKDGDLVEIKPENIQHDNSMTTTISFNEPLLGYALFKKPDMIAIGDEVASGDWKIIQSPHHRVEFDLSYTTTSSEEIFTEGESEILYSALESLRPVNKYAHYNLYVQPLADFSNEYFALYDYDTYPNLADFYSYNITPIYLEPESFIFKKSVPENVWEINHKLNSDIIIQCFTVINNSVELITPLSIEIQTQNTVYVRFSTSVSGYAFITVSDAVVTTATSPVGFSEYGLIDTWNSSNYMVNPKSIQLIGDTNIILEYNSSVFSSKSTIENYDNKYPISSSRKTWTIDHQYGFPGVIAQFFNNDGKEIFPSKFVLTNKNICTAYFNKPERGFVLLKKIGSLETIESILDKFLDNSYIKLGGGTTGAAFDAGLNNDLETPFNNNDGNQIKIRDLELKNDFYENKVFIQGKYEGKENLNIREMGIFDKNDNLLFYTYCDLIYKSEYFEFHVNYEIIKTI